MACTVQNVAQVVSCSLSGALQAKNGTANLRLQPCSGFSVGGARNISRKQEKRNVIVRAEAPIKDVPSETAKVSKSEGLGTFAETMAFSGPAPEVINGRLAMWGFAMSSIAELTDGRTIGEQFLASPVGNISFATMIVLATFIPCFVSDVSLGELLETASESGMPPQLKYANAPVERWTGRIAMVAFAIFLVIEGLTGSATYSVLKKLVGA